MDTLAGLDIEQVFASKGRTKLLHMLIHHGEMSISSLVQQGKLNHDNVQGHLKALVGLGLVREKIFGRIRIFQFNVEDKRARALKNLVEFWENRSFDCQIVPGGVSQRFLTPTWAAIRLGLPSTAAHAPSARTWTPRKSPPGGPAAFSAINTTA